MLETIANKTMISCVHASSFVSNSLLQPYGLQPARLLCPWDSPGNGLPYPPPGDLPDPGIKPESPVFSCTAGGFFTARPPGIL